MVEQTKWCVTKLREAGLKRSDFRARVTKNSRGEYGDVNIVLFVPTQEALKFASKLSANFEVVLFIVDGTVRHVTVNASGNPGISKFHCSKQKENFMQNQIDPKVQEAIEAVYEKIRQYPNYNGEPIHPINAARELQALGIELSPDQGLEFLKSWPY